MVALMKAFVPGTLLTWLVSLFIGSGGSTGGFLYIHHMTFGEHGVYWSWPLFTIGTLLAWFLLAISE